LGTAIFSSQQVKQQLDTLTAQAADGLVSESYAGLGAAAQTPFDLQPQIASLQAQQTAVNAVSGRMSTQQTALTQIDTIVSNVKAQMADLTNVTPSQIDNVALQAQSALQQVASLLDTTDGSDYVFAGTDTSNPPIPNPGGILSSGFYTQISTAVGGLGANGAAATLASTLQIASSNAAGTTPFSATLGAAATVTLGNAGPVAIGVVANANTFVQPSTGASTTGSYMRDILRGLATVANLSSSQVNDAGFASVVADTNTSLTDAISAMASDAGALGGVQSSLQAEATEASDTSTALTTQLSSAQNVNMAATISNLTEVQNQLSASYKVVGELSSLSLVDFL
jgi:flagellar hook-associated protein 3 FlgL